MKKYLESVVIAEPNCCVPAALEMVLRHHGIMTLSQRDLAGQLDIIPASEEIGHCHWGAQIKQDTINNLFSANNISLYETYIPITQFMDEYSMVEKINRLLHDDSSIICGFSYTALFANCEDSFQHVSIIVDISENEEEILLLDPGPKDAGYKTVRAVDLFYAIRVARDGLWCIK